MDANAIEIDTPPAAVPGRILIADDDEAFRRAMGKVLKRTGFECETAGSAAETVELLRTKEYDVLLADINMPGNAGLEMIAGLPAIIEGLPVILITGEPTVETASRSVRLKVRAYLTKPPDFTELGLLLHEAVSECRDLRLLKDNRHRIQHWDQELERLLRLLQQSPDSDRRATMQSYVRLTLRQLIVGLVDLEHLLIHDGERLGTDLAVEKQQLLNAVGKTISVLQKTKDHFKSKELGELRKELETIIRPG